MLARYPPTPSLSLAAQRSIVKLPRDASGGSECMGRKAPPAHVDPGDLDARLRSAGAAGRAAGRQGKRAGGEEAGDAMAAAMAEESRSRMVRATDWDYPKKNNDGRPLCVVHGADGPLGRALGARLGARYDVAAVGKGGPRLAFLSADLINDGVDNRVVEWDGGDGADALDALAGLSRAMVAMDHSRIGCLVLGSCRAMPRAFEGSTLSDIEECLQENFVSPIFLCALLLLVCVDACALSPPS